MARERAVRAPRAPLSDYDAGVFEDLKAEMDKWSVDWLSEESGVSKAALYFWLDGTTRYPRLSTVAKVAKALGFRLTLVRAGRPRLRRVK